MTTWETTAESHPSSQAETCANFPKPFTKVLIANRGAIATRIIRTLRELSIQSVAVYAEADAYSLHVEQADESFSLGEGPAANTYLNQQKLFAIARQCGAEAIHPGYGFLSENADFVERCEAEGIAFIGPTPEQMRTFGLKHSARALAEKNDVPLVPGSELLDSAEVANAFAQQTGFPLMLKSTAGGGGIGMQVVRNSEALEQAFESVKRLSANSFANDGVFLEKYIENARHIEVQVIGDGRGNVYTLGERDCSSQRRHQKVIEESPAPNLSDALRDAMFATAKQLMSAVQYRNAGTVEFIFDTDAQRFYFLEVNTRLQVEHGVTEMVWGVDLVALMLAVAAKQTDALAALAEKKPEGHAIQVRVYAEDSNKEFQPCAGLLTQVTWPVQDQSQDNKAKVRIDHWVEAGLEISPLFDPMLAKIIVKDSSRSLAIKKIYDILKATSIYGIETNLTYASSVLKADRFQQGAMTTNHLNDFEFQPATVDVLSAGTQTTIQDYPGRTGFWHIGVPPSGPFDSLAFRLGNRLLGNEETFSGLEFTLEGPTLRFNRLTHIVLTGACFSADLDGTTIANGVVTVVSAGQRLQIGKLSGSGARGYLLIKGGFDCPVYLGSQATFTLGKFGGHGGRALRTGDVLHVTADIASKEWRPDSANLPPHLLQTSDTTTETGNHWTLRTIYGPHGAPDFFSEKYITIFFSAEWEVHYHSSRTGIRLIGPKPEWARSDGGEAGMHPSNIHDNAYAPGTIDFTGDMPVILGPDGPSLGGFVCPATVIRADLWKLGQLKAGDKVRFHPIDVNAAVSLLKRQEKVIGQPPTVPLTTDPAIELTAGKLAEGSEFARHSPVVDSLSADANGVDVVYRAAGDCHLLVEYGPQVLDLRMRLQVHGLIEWLQNHSLTGMLELTPGIRSLQVHYDPLQLSLADLLAHLKVAERTLQQIEDIRVPSRIVYLPLSWDDSACQQAIDKYMQTVRQDAPWCPDNIEFIRRINGLESVQAVKDIVFSAHYVVMGLGDVYLGAPVATPIDPRHRLVTTKYNPARTWTAENSVGIGGAYLCVYGMEGPGGYQFIGRTLQMWNRYRRTTEFSQPWLLRFFDQIRFYEVSEQALGEIRTAFPKGKYPIRIEETEFSLRDYEAFLDGNKAGIEGFTMARQQAFQQELARWVASGQMNYQSEAPDETTDDDVFADDDVVIESPAAGSLWKILVRSGDSVTQGQLVAVLESMKMEIEIRTQEAGVVDRVIRQQGQQVYAGQPVLTVTADTNTNQPAV